MPLCVIRTTLKTIPQNFTVEFCSMMANVLKKDISKVSCAVHTNMPMCKGTTTEKILSLEVASVGVFDEDRNPGYSAQLYDFFQEKLGIPESNVIMWFNPIQAWQLGKRK